jgi:nitrite reductase/ring-hydroxylating ferredoxin subunit
LGEGDVEGEVVACPWHGWQFNVKTGACVNNPSAKVTSYEVTIEGADIKVRL